MIQFLPLLMAAAQGMMNGGGLTGAAKGAAGAGLGQAAGGLMNNAPQGTTNTNVLGQGGANQVGVAPQGWQSAFNAGGSMPPSLPPQASPMASDAMATKYGGSFMGAPSQQPGMFMGGRDMNSPMGSILPSFPGMPNTQWDPRMMGMRRGY